MQFRSGSNNRVEKITGFDDEQMKWEKRKLRARARTEAATCYFASIRHLHHPSHTPRLQRMIFDLCSLSKQNNALFTERDSQLSLWLILINMHVLINKMQEMQTEWSQPVEPPMKYPNWFNEVNERFILSKFDQKTILSAFIIWINNFIFFVVYVFSFLVGHLLFVLRVSRSVVIIDFI